MNKCPKCGATMLALMSGSFQISPWFCNKCKYVDKTYPDEHYKQQAELAESLHNPVSFLLPKKFPKKKH